MTTTHTDPWATLPTNWRNPTPPTPRPPKRYYRPLPNLKLPDETCEPRCQRCDRPPGRGSCRRCVIVCKHTIQPKTRRLAEVCIVRIRARAEERMDDSTGRRILLVPDCPHCRAAHVHSVEPAQPYRIAGCGQPYLLETR